MLTAVFKLLVASSLLLSSTTAAAATSEQVLEVLEGAIVGAIGKEVPGLQTCINDVLIDIGHSMVDSVEQLEEDSMETARANIRTIGLSFVALADVVKDCHLVEEEVERLEHIGANFANPVSFAYHVGKDLLVNGVSIFDDVQLALTDYRGGKWYDMGVALGNAVALAVLGSTELLEIEDQNIASLQVLEGIIAGAVDTELPDIQACATDILSEIGQDIMQNVANLRLAEDKSEAEASVHAIGISFVAVGDIVTDCGLAIQEVEKLQQIGANFADPTTFAYHFGRDLIVNGVSIYDDVELAMADYHDEKWFDMGVDVGKAAALAVLGSASPTLDTKMQ